jgi:hypothetical protein
MNATNEAWFRPKYAIKGSAIQFAWCYSTLEVDLVEWLAERNIVWDFTNDGSGVNAQQLFAISSFTHIGELVFMPSNPNASNGTFHKAEKLVTIDKVTFSANHTGTNTFEFCYALVNLTVAGTIGHTINLHWSTLLSVESMKSVISCLEDYSGTSSEYEYTVNFSDECWAELEANSVSPTGTTWAEYVDSLGWNI